MKTLIERIQERVKFNEIEPIKIKGFNSTLVIRRYEYYVETDVANLKIILSETHEMNKVNSDLLRLRITEDLDDSDAYDVIDIRNISDEKQVFDFIHFVLLQ